MRAITRVPEQPVAPMTTGAEWVTPTLSMAKPDRQAPALPQFSDARGRVHILRVRKGERARHRHCPRTALRAGRFPRFPSGDAQRRGHATWPNHLQFGCDVLSAAPAGGARGIRSDTRPGAKIPRQSVERSNLFKPGDGAERF